MDTSWPASPSHNTSGAPLSSPCNPFLLCYLGGFYDATDLLWDAVVAAANALRTAGPPVGSLYVFLPWPPDRKSGMDSKGCSLGRGTALVSVPRAQALLWIITSLSGAASLRECAYVCVCACMFWPACDRMNGGWGTETDKAININVILSHQGSLHIWWSITATTAPYSLLSHFNRSL